MGIMPRLMYYAITNSSKLHLRSMTRNIVLHGPDPLLDHPVPGDSASMHNEEGENAKLNMSGQTDPTGHSSFADKTNK